MKRFWKVFLISFIIGLITSIVFNMYLHKKELSNIEQIIKQHNSIKDLNQKYPTINKTPSSQSTVFGQDSVRVLRK
jgi:uncharacterized membrane-anchored protein YitT (DUF2179 family)